MPYTRPPITEAVLEFRTASLVDQSTLERLGRKLSKPYSNSLTETVTELEVDPTGNAKVKPAEWIGLKLTSQDQADMVILRKNICATIRLAPYNGWESFEERARANWEVWRRETGPLPLSRIGIRYVNRIDIPGANDLIQIEEYLNLLPKSPDRFQEPMSSFTIQVLRPFGSDNCKLLMNSSNVFSPLIGYTSFALDIDLSVEQAADVSLPVKEGEIWNLVRRMREHKNSVFESCISDKARALFNS